MIAETLSKLATDQTLIRGVSCAGLLCFLAFFIFMFFWTSQQRNQQLYSSLSQMPLEEEGQKDFQNEVQL